MQTGLLGQWDRAPTFGLRAAGVKVHPLLAFRAAHEEPSHSLSGEEGVGLRDLPENSLRVMCHLRGNLVTSNNKASGLHSLL